MFENAIFKVSRDKNILNKFVDDLLPLLLTVQIIQMSVLYIIFITM